jgi:transposase
MAFKRILPLNIWEIARRFHMGQSINGIATALGYDRKTVRAYIRLAEAEGFTRGTPLPEKDVVLNWLHGVLAKNGTRATAQKLLEAYREEIIELVTRTINPLKAKSAFIVICRKHALEGEISYTSFKRFVRDHGIKSGERREKTTCRIEVPPGHQAQIDYAKVGLLFDHETNRRRVLFAFIGTLGHSRHKYVEYTFSQNQQSFVMSHVRMFSFWGAVPKTIVLDNLKSGVIKPDLYDPVINRAYAEAAEYYGCLLDPARVVHPKDKGKVERDVQTVREFFRRELTLDPDISLHRLNQISRTWATEQYGRTKHGTTGEKPYEVFLAVERSHMLDLPPEPFEPAYWRIATVHPDHYIQVQNRYYSIPHAFVGQKVDVKVTHSRVEVYRQGLKIKEHPLARNLRRITDRTDFPENMQYVLDHGLPFKLRLQAQARGKAFGELVTSILRVHALINMRKAQGFITSAAHYSDEIVERAAEEVSFLAPRVPLKVFQAVLRRHSEQSHLRDEQIPLSLDTHEFLRPMDYFTHSTSEESL